ncbi:MAG: apolipoprotein N-acyltransferase [Thermodesulfovibrionales bacterium]|nr:apolipoprotein N-acyltransferase [Thermodesulfovibrionales bacterium]
MFFRATLKKVSNFFFTQKKFLIFIISGYLLVLSFPTTDFFPLAWIALFPILVQLYEESSSSAFKGGLLFGLVYFFGTTYWIYHALYFYGSLPLIVSISIVFLLSLYLSLYPALFCLLFSIVIKKTQLPALLIAPSFWTSLEFIRSYAFTGFPWSSIGYSQYKFLPFIQISDITGIYGISFLIVAFNGLIADIIILRKIRKHKPLHPFSHLLIGIVLLLLTFVLTFSYGFYRLQQEREGPYFKAAIIQGNIEQDKKWDPEYQQYVMNTYKSLTLQASKESPNIILWPETALPFYFAADKVLTEGLITYQTTLNSYLLFGSVLLKENTVSYTDNSGKATKLTNSAILLNPHGKVTYIYDKIHLVPFGEYVPMKSILFFLNKLVHGTGEYQPGDAYIKAITPYGSFATLICYEIIFPGMVRKFFMDGGDFIVTITNDAWFGYTPGPFQHFSMAVFRAIENRKPLLRAANSGISGFIDSNGRIIAKTNIFERTFIFSETKIDKTKTVYTTFGDIFSYFCILFSAILLISTYKKIFKY